MYVCIAFVNVCFLIGILHSICILLEITCFVHLVARVTIVLTISLVMQYGMTILPYAFISGFLSVKLTDHKPAIFIKISAFLPCILLSTRYSSFGLLINIK